MFGGVFTPCVLTILGVIMFMRANFVIGEAGILYAIVILVMVVFLGSWRLALIPAVTIPVSLIGTLAAIWLMGFSVNILTLLALVLATGLVVDDAIVVLENIERMRRERTAPLAAAGSRLTRDEVRIKEQRLPIQPRELSDLADHGLIRSREIGRADQFLWGAACN